MDPVPGPGPRWFGNYLWFGATDDVLGFSPKFAIGSSYGRLYLESGQMFDPAPRHLRLETVWDGTRHYATLYQTLSGQGEEPIAGLVNVDLGLLPLASFDAMLISQKNDAKLDNLSITTFVESGHLGDTNGDFVVDAADFINLKANFGMTTGATLGQGDIAVPADGAVDWTDLNTLIGNMSPGGSGTAAVTPEPATLSLLALGGLAVLRRRRMAGK
jgi:hypothetical protein